MTKDFFLLCAIGNETRAIVPLIKKRRGIKLNRVSTIYIKLSFFAIIMVHLIRFLHQHWTY